MAAQKNSSFLLLSLLLLLSSTSVSFAQTGIASFTSSPYSKQSCTDKVPKIKMFTGLNETLYGNGDICGTNYIVTCIGAVDPQQTSPCRRTKTVTVTVTDSCTVEADGKPCSTFVLSAEAFAQIARPQAGLAKVAYKLVSSS